MAKNSGGPNLSAISARSGREEGDEHDREERAHEGRREGGGQRLPALPLPRHADSRRRWWPPTTARPEY